MYPKLHCGENQIIYYKEAYSMAIDKVIKNKGEYPGGFPTRGTHLSFKVNAANTPNWSTIIINKQLPERLASLDTLSKNLWWSWNEEAIDLFKMVDEELWRSTHGNPILMLDFISISKEPKELENDPKFLKKTGFCIYPFPGLYGRGRLNDRSKGCIL